MRLVRSEASEPRVLVIGASIAGLLVAAALAPHVGSVLLVDADTLPDGPSGRRGVPQGPHSHVLLTRGRAAFEALLPGLDADLAVHAPLEVDWAADCVIVSSAGRVPTFRSGLVTRPCTRGLLEGCVRRRVLALPNVTVQDGTVVEGPLVAEGRVVGVRLAGGEEVGAALVIDASGRRSKTPGWLAEMGYAAPVEQVVNAGLAYATRLFARTDSPRDWKGLVLSSRPPDVPRAAALWPVEDDQWLVTLAGIAGHAPPTDDAGFLAFAGQLSDPILAATIAEARPTSRVWGYRKTENRWRRYDRLARMPEGLLVVGDGVCAFNPVYGQGMTVAALQAQALGALVADRGCADGLWRAWQRTLVPAIDPAWLLATNEDLRWPTTEGGDRGWTARATHAYIDGLLALTPSSPRHVEAFLSVMHMTRAPLSLGSPAVAGPILLHALRRAFA
jgi:2-polyprenyl-6-methoxyphenol hydroxylase-like FAD-dependent oxidoreductase